MNLKNLHYFAIQKEEKGVIFGICLIHSPEEVGVGVIEEHSIKVGIKGEEGNLVKMVYIGKNKQYAEKLYSKLVSQH